MRLLLVEPKYSTATRAIRESSPLPIERWWCGCVICFDTLFACYRIAIPIGIWLNFYDKYERDEIPSKLASFAISLEILWVDNLVLLRRISLLFAHNLLTNHSFSNQSNWLPHFVVYTPTHERERELLCVVSFAISPIVEAPSLRLSYFLNRSTAEAKEEKNQV